MKCVEISVFKQLNKYPPTFGDNELEILEKFVVTMYDKSSIATCVNDA